MKGKFALASILSLFLLSHTSLAQCVITSSDGYTVTISVNAVQVIPDRNPCPSGYNYNLRINYNVTFSGTNIPASLYTLQATAVCGSQTLFYDLPNSGGSGQLVTTANPWRAVSDCNTATVTSLSCNTSVIQIQGPGIASQNCNTTLPITLVKFEGESLEEGVGLTWETSDEKNFSHFEVEKSSTSELSFSELARVPGRGGINLRTGYSYVDENPVEGRNYYRLKRVDLDEFSEFSKIISVDWRGDKAVSVYPNPVVDRSFKIRIADRTEAPVMVTLTNEMGFQVFSTHIEKVITDFQLPESVPPGLYTLAVMKESKREVVKLIVP